MVSGRERTEETKRTIQCNTLRVGHGPGKGRTLAEQLRRAIPGGSCPSRRFGEREGSEGGISRVSGVLLVHVSFCCLSVCLVVWACV
ncbi:hypothetical protein J3F84DRAFT_383601 [Trichoderma pleuroticola]